MSQRERIMEARYQLGEAERRLGSDRDAATIHVYKAGQILSAFITEDLGPPLEWAAS